MLTLRFFIHGSVLAALGLGLGLPASESAASAFERGACDPEASNVRLVGCPAENAEHIHAVLRRVQCAPEELDAQLAENPSLGDWPEGARDAYVARSRAPLTIRCRSNEEPPCDSGNIAGKVIPVTEPDTVSLCVERINGRCDLARTVAHEIGHLAWRNGHPKSCAEYFDQPGFSVQVGWAALLACTPDADHYDPTGLKAANCDGDAWKK